MTDLTPSPASIKWPEPGANVPKPFAADYTRGAIDGWNACLEACKELNAVKGEAIRCKHGVTIPDCYECYPLPSNEKAEPCKHKNKTPDGFYCDDCKTVLGVCPDKLSDYTTFGEQPSEKKGSEVEAEEVRQWNLLHKKLEDYFPTRYINLSNPKSIQRFLVELTSSLINAGWKKEGKDG